jgi:VIT1/CCC1 family predicted Fe2+/Mn2+ transporter
LLLAGVAALVAGAMSMAAGEYVSVSSQSDTEKADLAREKAELLAQPEHEHQELAAIYVKRGLTQQLAKEVAQQLMEHDDLGAHARDELGINEMTTAKPVQAAFTSALTFSAGAALPLLAAMISPASLVVPIVAGTSLVVLTALGVISAKTGGAPVIKATLRVVFWGVLAMALTAAVGKLFGTVV